jgi:hypothetical protein
VTSINVVAEAACMGDNYEAKIFCSIVLALAVFWGIIWLS